MEDVSGLDISTDLGVSSDFDTSMAWETYLSQDPSTALITSILEKTFGVDSSIVLGASISFRDSTIVSSVGLLKLVIYIIISNIEFLSFMGFISMLLILILSAIGKHFHSWLWSADHIYQKYILYKTYVYWKFCHYSSVAKSNNSGCKNLYPSVVTPSSLLLAMLPVSWPLDSSFSFWFWIFFFLFMPSNLTSPSLKDWESEYHCCANHIPIIYLSYIIHCLSTLGLVMIKFFIFPWLLFCLIHS